MSGIQIVGSTNNTTAAEVEQNTNAIRTTVRPEDYGSLGIFHLGANNGTTGMTAGLGAASPIFSFCYRTTNVVLVKRVLFEMGSLTGFAAGSAQFNMFAARSFTAPDSGGTNLVPVSADNRNKLRTSMFGGSGSSNFTTTPANYGVNISTTAALTVGTRTLDTNALGSISVSVPTTANFQIVPPKTTLFDQRVAEYPLVCAQNEGFVIQATVPITGTWVFSVQITWLELASY